MSQVVTELVIDADTSGADQFSRAMDGAAQAAQRGVEQTSGLNLNLIALGAGAIGAAAAAKQVLDQVVEANKAMADWATTADRVGLSLKDFQGVKLAGEIAGLKDSEINAGLEKSAELLNDASRNANSLSKEFEANGLSIRNANGQLISQNQLLQIAADLVSRARNPQDAVAIAQMLGFTKEWIPFLQQGAGAMRELGDRAQDAGAVMDDETIHRAQEFDAQWRKSSAEFSAYMKSALYGLMPYVDDLIEGAEKFIKSIDRAKIQQASDESFKKFNEAAGIPESGVISIDTGKLEQAARDFNDQPVFSTDTWVNFGKALWSGFTFQSPEEAAKNIPGYAASQITEPSYPSADQMDAAFKKFWKAQDAAQDAAQDRELGLAGGGFSNVASRDQAKDAVDRAINSLTRHTAAQEADARAVGRGDAALAAFRVEAAETAAIQANGGKITADQAAQFEALKDRAAAAAEALARAKVNSQISFNGQTAFLSQGDIAIANQLKGIYGNDVPAALNSTYAATLRVHAGFREVSTQIESGLVSGLADITTGTKSVGQGFSDMSNMVIRAIEQMIIKLTIVQPLMQSLQMLAGGFTGGGGIGAGLGSMGISYGLPGTAGSNLFGPVAPSAHGNVFSAGAIVPFALGGVPDVVASPTIAPMAMFGEAGEEAIMPLRRGADGRLGVAAAGGGSQVPSVTINNYTDARPQVERGSNGDITVTLRKAMDSAVGESLSTGAGRRVLSSQFGVKPFTGQ